MPSPEKELVQKLFWIPTVREFYQKQGRGEPLRILCLPGRQCRFLLELLKRRYTVLSHVTCIEYNAVEALLIRGRLAEYATDERAPIDLIQEPVYDYFSSGSRAVEMKYQVVDLDMYGRFDEPGQGLLDAVEAVVDVQVRANVPEWVLLLTVEVASARAVVREDLDRASARMMDAYGTTIGPWMDHEASAGEPATQLLRYGFCVVACVIEMAFPRFEGVLQRAPAFYRGSDIYGQPSMRALMGAFAFGFKRRRPRGALGDSARRRMVQSLLDRSMGRALRAKAIVADAEGAVRTRAGLDSIQF